MFKKFAPWVLAVLPALVFLQSLPFKFTGAAETQHIFGEIGGWFGSLGVDALAEFFRRLGPYVIGGLEAIAAVGLLIPATRHWGALLGTALLGGAIFFHIVTPLGIAVRFPGTEAADPTLFILAVVGFICCLTLVLMNARRLRSA